VVWVKLDDKLHGHRKTLALFDGPCPGDSLALWTLAASWCGDQLTDGAVPHSFVRRSGLDKRAADELVRVGLWERTDEGFQFHDWLERNKSREKVENERRAALERKTNGAKSLAKGSREPPANFDKGSPLPEPDPIPTRSEDASASSGARAQSPEDFGPQPGSVWAQFESDHGSLTSTRVAQHVSDQLRAVTGKAWAAMAHVSTLAWIAQQPLAEWTAVLAAIAADPWCKEHAKMVTPQHIVKQWPKYSEGPAKAKEAERKRGAAYRIVTMPAEEK